MGRPRYEMWEWLDGPNGKKNQQVVRLGTLARELQKYGKKIPISPDVEEDFARVMESIETYNQHQANGCKCELCKNAKRAFASMRRKAEKQKPGK